MTTSPHLHTDRLILQPITPAIIHDLFNTKTQKEIMNYFGCNEADYEKYKLMHEKGIETHRLSMYSFLIIHKETQTPMGEAGFHTWNTTHQRAELYYILRKDEDKRKGYMTEALTKILAFGFQELRIHRVKALIAPWNEASVQLIQKFGFKKEGTMREDYFYNGKNEDSDCYALLKWEWEQQYSKKENLIEGRNII